MARNDSSDSSDFLVSKAHAELIATIVGTAVIVTFLILAARNVLHGIAVVPSGLWILLVVFVTISRIRESGLRTFALSVLGAFSRRQILVVRTGVESKTLEVGFTLFSWRVIERRVPAGDLGSLQWSAGQASDLSGRDANDWSVALWYWHRNPEKEARERRRGRRKAGQSLIIVGPPRAKPVTEALGQRVASFLQDSGISLAAEASPL